MADAAPQPPFAVDDRVVYPNLGLCRVSGFETLTISGQQVSFVTLKREADGATVRVPPGKLSSAGVRRIAGRDEVAEVFRFLKSDSDKATLDWKQRARTNTERMAQGGLLGLAEVVKGLQVLSELRPLPTKERELYDSARALLVSELAASLSCSPCDAEDTVDVALSPPGKERPRRTVEEFKRGGGDEDALGDDLLGMDGDLEGIPTDEPPPEEEAPGEQDEAADEKPAKKPARGTKAKAPPAAARRPILSDEEVTMTMARAVALPSEQKKRGRPAKAKAAGAAAAGPKKRGRPPGSKTEKASKKPAATNKKAKPAAKDRAGKGKKGGRS